MKLIALLLLLLLSGLAAASIETEDIRDISSEIKIRNASWTPGPTSVSGLSPAEKQRLALPPMIPMSDRRVVVTQRVLQHEPHFNWRDKGKVTPVRSQGSCGSCWAFSAIATVESAFLIHAEKNLDLSEQHLVSSCCSAGSCSGGWPDWALDYIRDTGIPDEACYPYKARNGACNPCPGWDATAYKIKDHVYISPTENDFKCALEEYGPVSVVLSCPDDWYYYRSGIYEPIMNVGWANHAVLLTGWDDSDGCWFIKNSWGQGWGEQGYARVKYGNLEKYNYAYAITGIVEHGAAPNPHGWMSPVSAAASSEYSSHYQDSRAIDNDVETHWFSKRHEERPAVTFDLGELLTVSKVRTMIFHKDIPMTLTLETSGDGENWHPAVERFEILNGSAYIGIPFSKTKCRYIRMSTKGPRPYGTCTEFEAYVSKEEEPEYNTSLQVTYTNRTETVTLQEDLVSIALLTNDTKMFEWWNR